MPCLSSFSQSYLLDSRLFRGSHQPLISACMGLVEKILSKLFIYSPGTIFHTCRNPWTRTTAYKSPIKWSCPKEVIFTKTDSHSQRPDQWTNRKSTFLQGTDKLIAKRRSDAQSTALVVHIFSFHTERSLTQLQFLNKGRTQLKDPHPTLWRVLKKNWNSVRLYLRQRSSKPYHTVTLAAKAAPAQHRQQQRERPGH